jgi:hypothetical protein
MNHYTTCFENLDVVLWHLAGSIFFVFFLDVLAGSLKPQLGVNCGSIVNCGC